MEMVKGLNTDEEREQMWSNLASGKCNLFKFKKFIFLILQLLKLVGTLALGGLLKKGQVCMILNQFEHCQLCQWI